MNLDEFKPVTGWFEEYLLKQAEMARVVFGEEEVCPSCFATGYVFAVRRRETPEMLCPFCLDKPYSLPFLGDRREDLSTRWHQ